MTMFLQLLAACAAIVTVGLALAYSLDGEELDEAERRDNGYLLQDDEQAAALLRKYEECRERMGRECCLHPEYKFQERHRQVVGKQ